MSTILIIICIIQFIHFIWYIVSVRIKEGFIIDFWAFQLIINNIIYYFILYPFAKAVQNEAATGDTQYLIAKHVDEALIIVSIGYFFIWMGKYWYDYVNKKQVINNNLKLWPLAKIVRNVIKSKNALWVMFLVFTPCILFVAIQALSSSNLLGARESLSESDSERPLYNVAVSIYPVFISILGVLYLSFKKFKYLIGFLLLLGFSFIFGSRGAAFGALSSLIFLYSASKGRGIGWLKISLLGMGLIVSVLGFGILRSGENKVTGKDIFESLLYGNTFSDLRDFAWVLAEWDRQLILGKTYLSAIISFIPSGLSEFRSVWSLGKVTTRIAGLTGSFHGGLRLTIFGESYINFGIIGVIIFSFTFGYFLQNINRRVMFFVKNNSLIEGYSMMLMTALVFSCMITAGFFTLYTIFIPMLILNGLLSKKQKN